MSQPCVEARVNNAADSRNTNLLPKTGCVPNFVAKIAVAGLQLLEGRECRFFKAKTAFYYVFMQYMYL